METLGLPGGNTHLFSQKYLNLTTCFVGDDIPPPEDGPSVRPGAEPSTGTFLQSPFFFRNSIRMTMVVGSMYVPSSMHAGAGRGAGESMYYWVLWQKSPWLVESLNVLGGNS